MNTRLFAWLYALYRVFGWIRNFSAGLVGMGIRFHHNIAIFNENNFYNVFKEFGVCCWNFCFIVKCVMPHTFQDFELAVFIFFKQDV